MESDREKFRETIKKLLFNHGPMKTFQLYDQVKNMHPTLCDDSVHCCCGKNPTYQPEWKHKVRWAQQDLKNNGEIELISDHAWRIKKKV